MERIERSLVVDPWSITSVATYAQGDGVWDGAERSRSVDGDGWVPSIRLCSNQMQSCNYAFAWGAGWGAPGAEWAAKKARKPRSGSLLSLLPKERFGFRVPGLTLFSTATTLTQTASFAKLLAHPKFSAQCLKGSGEFGS